jgi:hypothetical protein
MSPQLLEAEMQRRNQEQKEASAFAEMEVNQTENPFIQAGQELMAQSQPMQPPMQQPMQPEMAPMQQPMGQPQGQPMPPGVM